MGIPKPETHYTFSAEDHLSWIEQVARKVLRQFSLPMSEYDELVAAGSLGMLEAAERFQPELGVAFRAYALLRVRGAMIDAVRRNSDLSSRGRHFAKALSAHFDAEYEEPMARDQQERKSKLKDALKTLASGAIAFRLTLDGDSSLEDFQRSDISPESLLAHKQDGAALQDALEKLPTLERLTIEEYYYKDTPFCEIAEQQGVTKGCISKAHKRALERLSVILAVVTM